DEPAATAWIQLVRDAADDRAGVVERESRVHAIRQLAAQRGLPDLEWLALRSERVEVDAAVVRGEQRIVRGDGDESQRSSSTGGVARPPCWRRYSARCALSAKFGSRLSTDSK